MKKFALFVFSILFVIMIHPVFCQQVEELVPEDDVILPDLLRSFSDTTVRLAAGLYEIDDQIRFDADSNLIVEGAGSGMGENATILDFQLYSDLPGSDGRAFSVRGGVVFRNLTIVNVGNRATDLRTGNVDSPSDEVVIFENVWFVNCNDALKSTGGRTVGTAENPMQVRHCVFAVTPDYPFGDPAGVDAVDLRDNTYAIFDHCDFLNFHNSVVLQIDDPAAAPNEGPQITLTNSVILASSGDEAIDVNVSAGSFELSNSVVWDSVNEGDIDLEQSEFITQNNIVVGNPLYVSASADTSSDNLDVNLLPGSPAIGLGSDGRNAGSVAEQNTFVPLWNIY